MQDAEILLGRPLRPLGDQPVVSQAEATGGEQVLAVAVVGEGAWLAHQPVDDVPVFDAMLAPAPQPRQPLDPPLRIPDLDMVGVQAGLDPFADQPAGHRIGVAGDVDGAARIHSHMNALTCVHTLARQRPQHGQLFRQPRLPASVPLGQHLPHKRFVRHPTVEVTAAAQQQRLIQRPLELPMALLDVAVLVRLRRIDGLPLQTVVLQQGRVALLKRVPIAARRHGRGQRIGAMHLGYAAQFGQGVLQPVTEALEALGEADRPGLPVRVGQHEVVEQMRKRHAADGDLQARGVREVRGRQPAGFMHLGEEDLLGRPMHGAPLLDPPLQGTQLAVGEASGVLPLQPVEQGLGFQARIELELFLDAVPDVGKRIAPGSPGMVHAHLTGQLAEPPVLASGLVVDASLGGGLALGQVQLIEAAQPTDVQIGDHPKPPCRKGLRIGYPAQLLGKSNCR